MTTAPIMAENTDTITKVTDHDMKDKPSATKLTY